MVSCESYLLGAWDMWGAPTIPGIALGHGPKVHTQDPSPGSLFFGKSWWGGRLRDLGSAPRGQEYASLQLLDSPSTHPDSTLGAQLVLLA